MLRSARRLEPLARSLPPRVHFVGPCLWEPGSLDEELSGWLRDALASGRPLLYVQHGSTFNLPRFWPLLVEALGDRPVNVAVSAARMHGEVGEVPPNFLVRPHIPQAAFLARARAAISSGNSTAVLGALMAGVPSLLIPGGGEQVDLAERCVGQGAALSFPPQDLDGPALRDSLERVLAGEELRPGTARLQRGLKRLAGFRRAADLVCELAVSRQPVVRPRPGARRQAPDVESTAHA